MKTVIVEAGSAPSALRAISSTIRERVQDAAYRFANRVVAMRQLPDDVAAYKRTPVFTAATLPEGLKRDHATKAGVWGLIHVEAGQLRFEDEATGDVMEIGPGDRGGVIEPEVLHRVAAIGDDVRFFVEFYRRA